MIFIVAVLRMVNAHIKVILNYIVDMITRGYQDTFSTNLQMIGGHIFSTNSHHMIQ